MLTHDLGDGARLEALEPWRAREFAEHVEGAREHLRPWIPFASTVSDEASARELLRRFADEQARDGGRLYGIWLDTSLVGGTLFRTFDIASGVCEIGVWLAPQAQGRGLVTRAVRHMIWWAFAVRGLSRVEWLTQPGNEPSRAVARRLGMSREGLLRGASVVAGTRVDLEVWSLLATEWDTSDRADRDPGPDRRALA